MSLETTLILFKTDCVEKKLVGEILNRFESEGFKIRGIKMISLSTEILNEHYAHVADRPFFPEILNFMQACPVIALALEGENAIARVRELLGPTDSNVAEKGTIRGDFGVDTMRNVCHASDSQESASTELKRFFGEEEIFSY
ncbi:MAG: nucleoside-diphosphate kinase [Verrucomicrobiota bacterium]|jgi:nucleoside-diphosphate kinase|nr:nucleoside-diphosphate kinase [Verrucomicrobiota bacterium]HAA87291.1 nucleoside-diphosphate kinase [Verrucomicrobiales bacterium]|tara:strand:- start:155 stop:580 length:426 start_codon:yes stop_codon:yes gene_type:complete